MIAKLRCSLTMATLAGLAASVLLLAAPWVTGFSAHALASHNAFTAGLLILSFALAAIFRLRDWRSWMNLVPGLWVTLSPWLLGFVDNAAAALVHVATGLAVSVPSAIELCKTETLCLDD